MHFPLTYDVVTNVQMSSILFRSRLHPALIQLLLIHAIQILLSLKPISYTHYIYIICTKSTTKAKGMLYGRLEILLFTEILPLCNFSFHLSWWLLKIFTTGDSQIVENWKSSSSQNYPTLHDLKIWSRFCVSQKLACFSLEVNFHCLQRYHVLLERQSGCQKQWSMSAWKKEAAVPEEPLTHRRSRFPEKCT